MMAFFIDRKFFVSNWRRYRLNQRRVVVAESVEKGDVHYKSRKGTNDDAEVAILANDGDSGAEKRKEISRASKALKSQQSTLKNADKETVRKFAAYKLLEDTPKSRAFYRVNAIRRLTGSRGVFPVQPKLDNSPWVRKNSNGLCNFYLMSIYSRSEEDLLRNRIYHSASVLLMSMFQLWRTPVV